MTYTGNVKVGGPPDTREIEGLTITKLAVGPMDNNAYLLRDTATGEGLLIDAANEADRLIELIGGTPITWIVTTHRHGDHWQALAEVQQAAGAVVVAHTEDAAELPIPVDDDITDGDILRFGDAAESVIHLRGHTPGSVALYYDAEGTLSASPHLLTGDSLFPGGPGKTGNPKDFTQLMDDLGGAGVRAAAGRDVGVPGSRRRHHPRHRAPAPGRTARPRLVSRERASGWGSRTGYPRGRKIMP